MQGCCAGGQSDVDPYFDGISKSNRAATVTTTAVQTTPALQRLALVAVTVLFVFMSVCSVHQKMLLRALITLFPRTIYKLNTRCRASFCPTVYSSIRSKWGRLMMMLPLFKIAETNREGTRVHYLVNGE